MTERVANIRAYVEVEEESINVANIRAYIEAIDESIRFAYISAYVETSDPLPELDKFGLKIQVISK